MKGYDKKSMCSNALILYVPIYVISCVNLCETTLTAHTGSDNNKSNVNEQSVARYI